jgi:hypothetical protein
MAAFEWCVKDFIAQVLDTTDVYDERVEDAKWITLDKSRVLAQREATASAGAVLIHPTQGWHDPSTLNQRFRDLFDRQPVANDELDTLYRLWLVRHSVVHNGGYVTRHDAYRMKAPNLSEKTVRLTPEFVESTADFLARIVRRLGDPVGSAVLNDWFRDRAVGTFADDKLPYRKLKLILTVEERRAQELPVPSESDYEADRATAQSATPS